MTSAGGLVPLAEAAAHPARLLLSGPAGGVRAAAARGAARAGSPTRWRSTWGAPAPTCAWCRAACPSPPHAHASAGLPVRLPSLAIHTIGAGGGSVARARSRWRARRSGRRARAPTRACLLRAGWHRGHGHRRRPGARRASRPATELPGFGRLDVAAAPGRARPRRGDAPRASSRSSTRPWRAPCAWSRSSRASIRATSRWSRSAARGRSTRARWPTSSACRRSSCRRGPACSPRSASCCAPEQRELVRVVADARRARRASTTRGQRSPRARAALVPGGDVDQWLDCRYAGQSHELTVADVDDFPTVHAQRNGYARPGVRRSRWWRCARASSRAAPLAVTDLPDPYRAAARGPAVVAEPDCTLWVPDGLGRRRRARRARGSWSGREPGGAADPRVPARVGGRRDGRGAAARRVEPQHQGAGRLLGGAVHRRRRAPRPGRAHPRAPRLDAGLGGGGDRHRAADAS